MTATATDVKNHFGEYLEKARTEPVTVEKTGRNVAVLVNYDEYERLRALEDAHWAARARAAEESGYLSAEETAAFLNSRLAEKEETA